MTQPFETVRVRLAEGYDVQAYVCGDVSAAGARILFGLNGGPGLPSEYLREGHAWLADEGFALVFYDQLGCGASDRPDDEQLWTLARYVEEVEQVRAALGIQRFHLLGHSWGTWLGTEYCLTYPERVASYIVADGACDIPHLRTELERLRAALGAETVAMMRHHEAAGTLTHPEYAAALTLLNYRHVCRLPVWPEALTRSLAQWNEGPYRTMQGPNEFTYTGNMREWNRVPDMHGITAPALVICGAFDELTPACSRAMYEAMPNAQLEVLEDASHMPFYETPEVYRHVVGTFLKAQRE
ncbi:proline iminopeptidase-family hydrolase [Pandoraea sp. PE-S2R-1]|uniref:proline iminopeptidase-family hydrolase n=1 Tax=Pandoraea sp. PE-S2R-1 TaxID=1986994 RepID=UPI000B3F9775|nr:proline iminopeptidase-family hydrolase [Pandoraea sp. PE-S2R-1]